MAAPGGDYGQTNSITPSGGVLGAYPAKFSDSSFVQENGAYYIYLQVPARVLAVSYGAADSRCASDSGA